MSAVIELEHVYKEYADRAKPAVCDANFCVEAGDFVTILGTSGSGKTTLLKMINGLVPVSRGKVKFMGEDITAGPINNFRRKIGYVIQQAGLFPHWTVYDNIATVPRILKWEEARIKERVYELMDMVQLDPGQYAKSYPKKLSGGEQQRVGLARALAADPPVMLMDEPFGAIDAITREKLQNELLAIQSKLHKTILFVTHDVQEAFKMGNKVIVMHNGIIQQYAEPFAIMFHPATEYVAQLVKSGDFFDRLKMMPASAAITPIKSGTDRKIVVSATENLSQVLTAMIAGNESAVAVKDVSGKIVGEITMSLFQNELMRNGND